MTKYVNYFIMFAELKEKMVAFMKKPYTKPEMTMVALRTEERMATCDYYYKVGQSGSGCFTNFFFQTDPASCIVMTTEQSIS